MKIFRASIAFAVLLASTTVSAATMPSPPLPSGQYIFQQKFAEQPSMSGIPLLVKINGSHIVLINRTPTKLFPKGIIEEGTLMWHAASKQWIIGNKVSDSFAKEVGGCSAGPSVVDLWKKIYWTC